MRTLVGLFLVVMVSGPALAATPMPPLPSRADCDERVARKGDLEARFGSMQTYLSCLLTGSPGTLVNEAWRLMQTSDAALQTLDEETPPEVVIATVRNARAMNNLAMNTLGYLQSFLYQVKDEAQRKSLCERGEFVFEKGALLDELALTHAKRVMLQYPGAEPMLQKSQATTRAACEGKFEAYREKRMAEPERNFAQPQSYMATVVACAEQDVDFYRLIDAEAFRKAAVGDDPFAKAMDSLERLDYHCHLHPAEEKD